jgi:asparagine synthase (glutamine-hydrolysing)
MSGICGVIHREADRPINEVILHSMNNTPVHRGVHEEGYHVEPGVGLAMRRLAVPDVAVGQKPMTNEDDSICVVFDGQIYNHVELRRRLEGKGHVLRTFCDTEVLPHLYEDEGDRFPELLNGMFAIALWDRTNRRLLLVRDQLGMKSLYIAPMNESVVFASAFNAVMEYPEVNREIDLMAFSEYLTFDHTIPPRTMLAGVQKLPAGHMAIYEHGKLKVREYWDLRFPPESDKIYDEQLHVERFRELFMASVKRVLLSDAPMGVFFSGGVDTSSVTAAMSRLGVPKIHTYTLGYPGGDLYGDLGLARIVSDIFQTDHQEIMVSARDYKEAIPEFVLHMGDLVGDWACILTLLLAKRAKEDVSVVLSGQGPDETLGSLSLVSLQRRIDRLRRFQRLPRWLRSGMPGAMKPILSSKTRDWLARGNRDIARINFEEPLTLAWQFDVDEKRRFCPVLNEVEEHCHDAVRETYERSGTEDLIFQVIYVYTKMGLAENLLMHDDKMTMAYGVELRTPFLDRELMEMIAQIPSYYIILREAGGDYVTKGVLKRAMRGILPDVVLNQPKSWFAVPLGEWFQDPLAEYCRDVLLSNSARSSGIYDAKAVEGLLENHRCGPTARGARVAKSTLQIKNLMFFETWRQLFLVH